MKKVFILFLVLGFGKLFSQSVIFTEDFTAPTFTKTGDWLHNNNGGYPACTVSGSSAGSRAIAQNLVTTFQETGTSALGISTSTYVNIQVSWNMIRGTSSSPAITFQWSNNAGSTWNTATYTPPASVGVWTAVPTVTLPAGANLGTVYLRWTYTGTGTFGQYVEIDDIKVTGTPTPSYYYKGSGALDNVANWGTNTNGTGANPIDFVTNNQNFYLQNVGSAVLTAPWTISGNNTFMNIGDGTSGNKCNLTIPATFALTIGTGAKLNVNNSSTLTIQNTTFPSDASVVLASNSTVDFAQSSAVTLWDITYGNLILSGSGNRNQSNTNSGVTVVSGDFTIGASNSYVMIFSPGTITELQGKITCNGTITTDLSNLTIDGSSTNTIGTLNFTGSGINDLILDRSTQTLTLGGNLSISGLASLPTLFTNGSLNLNGKALAINGAVTFPASSANGEFIGSTTSSLIIGGSGTITNGLIMNQATVAAKTLGTFSLSRSSSTLALGSDLVSNTSIFTNGSLSLSGKSYSINGVCTFPASISNGAFIGSTTSSLTFGGSSLAFTNSLLMSQASNASKSLGVFAYNRGLTTLSLGNNLIVSGTASFPNGVVDINGTLLTLSGPLALPTTTANKGIQGSLTSSLTIDGSGAITGSLYMIQTSASTRALSQLTMNRNGQTLTLGKNLETYGEILPLDGTIASAGNLFIRSNATNKGRIGPVGATAAITGNVTVETFALGGNTDWTNLGPSGINNLTVASWEGQIPMSCLSCPNDQYSAGSYFVSIQAWDPTAAASSTAAYLPLSYTTALNVGQGYWTFLGNGLPTTTNITWTVSGTAVQGPQTITLTTVGSGTADGYNLISNPYASPISWDAIISDPTNSTSAIDNAIYVYSPDLGYSTAYAGGISSDYPGGITDTIPMGQGFYVQAQAATSLNILEAHKIKSNTPLLKTSNANIGTVVRLNLEGGGYKDVTAIRFHSDATPAFDKKLDARKIFSSPGYAGTASVFSQRTTISTKSGSEDYSINSLPNAITDDAVIPVLVKVYATGQHTITGSQLENLPNSCVQLKDKLTNATHDLKSGPYVFNISDTTAAPRFELRVCADVAMSVKNQNNIDQHILVNNDANGAYVKFDFDKPTKSVISVTNILGQKIIDDKSVTVDKDKVTLDIPEKHQLIFVTVTSENNKVTKKIIR